MADITHLPQNKGMMPSVINRSFCCTDEHVENQHRKFDVILECYVQVCMGFWRDGMNFLGARLIHASTEVHPGGWVGHLKLLPWG